MCASSLFQRTVTGEMAGRPFISSWCGTETNCEILSSMLSDGGRLPSQCGEFSSEPAARLYVPDSNFGPDLSFLNEKVKPDRVHFTRLFCFDKQTSHTQVSDLRSILTNPHVLCNSSRPRLRCACRDIALSQWQRSRSPYAGSKRLFLQTEGHSGEK